MVSTQNMGSFWISSTWEGGRDALRRAILRAFSSSVHANSCSHTCDTDSQLTRVGGQSLTALTDCVSCQFADR